MVNTFTSADVFARFVDPEEFGYTDTKLSLPNARTLEEYPKDLPISFVAIALIAGVTYQDLSLEVYPTGTENAANPRKLYEAFLAARATLPTAAEEETSESEAQIEFIWRIVFTICFGIQPMAIIFMEQQPDASIAAGASLIAHKELPPHMALEKIQSLIRTALQGNA